MVAREDGVQRQSGEGHVADANMPKTPMLTGEGSRTPRRFPRLRCMIPVHAVIDHAWDPTSVTAFSGTLMNIGCGGGTLRLPAVLPPRTRLRLTLPTTVVARNLPAQVVWTSAVPGRRAKGILYGIRWMEALSPQALHSLQPLLGRETA